MATLELIERIESWLQVLDQSSYYELLGILEIADEAGIQQAFHEFSESFHPDRHRREPEELRQAVTKIYQRGAEAYGVLRDPRTRAQYDIALAQGQLRFNPGQTAGQHTQSQDLAEIAQTPGGKLHARQALRALSEGKLQEAQLLLQKAQLVETFNPRFDAKVQDLLRLAKDGKFFHGG